MIVTVAEGIAVAALLAGIAGLAASWRQTRLRRRDLREIRETLEIHDRLQKSLCDDLRVEMKRGLGQCRDEIAEAEKNAQATMELLRDGRLEAPARSRALRMLRSGMSAETAAAELGLARNEVQLLEKVSVLLAPPN